MARGRRSEAWDHTATLAAEIHNASWRAEKVLHPADWHPFMTPEQKVLAKSQAKGSVFKITDPFDVARLLGVPTQIVR